MRQIVVWDDDADKLEIEAERQDVPIRSIIEELVELYWDDYKTYHCR